MRWKRCLVGTNAPTDLSPERCWLFISQACLCPILFVGEAKDKSPALAANLILRHSSHAGRYPARSGNPIALLYIPTVLLFWKVINDLQMFGLLMNKRGNPKAESAGRRRG